MRVLITGGAGYIGSHMTRVLLETGHNVVVADSLERGFEEAVDKRATLEIGDLREKPFISHLFSDYEFDAVIHFAAYISVGESMEKPEIYFENNIQSAVNILDGMTDKGVNNFVFSSTAAVYGSPETSPIPETHSLIPTNPYGESKLAVEKVLHWYNKTKNLSYTALRYFNACGASPDSSSGEKHNPETHLIPNAINAAIHNREFTLYGNDYNTPDGTCIRDYIHVLDLAQAHVVALDQLIQKPGAYTYNVGTGKGYSNKEVIDVVQKVTGTNFEIVQGPRREGDPDQLVADATKIKGELGFDPQYSDLETIVTSAYNWHKKNSS